MFSTVTSGTLKVLTLLVFSSKNVWFSCKIWPNAYYVSWNLEEGKHYIKLSLCYTVVYYYNGAQRYERFWQVGLSWAWWDWPLTWLTNHRPSVLWHCWLGHLTREIFPEMMYSVTINHTIPFLKPLIPFLKPCS